MQFSAYQFAKLSRLERNCMRREKEDERHKTCKRIYYKYDLIKPPVLSQTLQSQQRKGYDDILAKYKILVHEKYKLTLDGLSLNGFRFRASVDEDKIAKVFLKNI